MGHRDKIVSEKEVVDAFLDSLRHNNQGNFVLHPDKPDDLDRRRKAPDFSASDPSTKMKLAIEITSLYQSSRAGHEESIWMETVGGIDRELTGKIQGSAWIFIPELTKDTPHLQNGRERLTVRTRFVHMLPSIIETMPTSSRPQRFVREEVPFPFEIRKRKATGSWVAISRLVSKSHKMTDVVTYLRHVLPEKDKKFSHPDYASHKHILLLENRVSFLEHDFAQEALVALSKQISLESTDRIFLVEFESALELRNPWKHNIEAGGGKPA